MPAGPVVVCYDGSAHSEHGVLAARDLVAPQDIIVLSVWQSVAAKLNESGSFGVIAGFDDEAIDASEKDAARRVAEEAAQTLRAAGRRATARVEAADDTVWAKIVEVANEADASLIVTGSRGRGQLKSVLLGSVSREILSHAGRPVLLVPPWVGNG